MKTTWIYLALLVLLLPACSSIARDAPTTAPLPDLTPHQAQSSSRDVSWGSCDLVIARDGSEYTIVPTRSADAVYYWGYHINAVKLLEVSPGKNCIKITKIKLLPNGDVAVDISITHPYKDPCYTGFDVMGIIIFPSSQTFPDPDLYYMANGYYPIHYYERIASYRKGDAELMNPDGHTVIWAPDRVDNQKMDFDLEEADYPILRYYPGRMASGENLGTHNGFKRYYTNQNRHMFEAEKTATRTFVIRPPAEGPILASYSVYAHWAPPSVYPVTNPAVDFPPEANSPLPYEFRIEQIGPIDPDAPPEVNAENVIWHIKYWHFGIDDHQADSYFDLTRGSWGSGDIWLSEAFDICPDCYRLNEYYGNYSYVPDALPGTWPIIFVFKIHPPGWKQYHPRLATAYWIAWLDIEAYDGEW